MKTKTIAWDVVEWDVVVACVVAAICVMDPTEEDWQVFIRPIAELSTMRVLIHSHGGVPRPAQLARLDDFLLDTVPFAVLTDGAPWPNRRIRCFPTSALDRALDHLLVPHHRRARIEGELRQQRREIGSLRV